MDDKAVALDTAGTVGGVSSSSVVADAGADSAETLAGLALSKASTW